MKSKKEIELNILEDVISNGLDMYVKVGDALLLIKSKKLYKKGYQTYDNYCRIRWNMSPQHCNRLIDASKIAKKMLSRGEKDLPKTENQLRALASAEDPIEAWIGARAHTGKMQPTAEEIVRFLNGAEVICGSVVVKVKTDKEKDIVRLAEKYGGYNELVTTITATVIHEIIQNGHDHIKAHNDTSLNSEISQIAIQVIELAHRKKFENNEFKKGNDFRWKSEQ